MTSNKSKDGDYVEFTPPSSITAPEGDGNESGEFDMVCTFKVKGSKWCMTKLGETPMPVKDDKDEKPSYKRMANEIAEASTGEPPDVMGGY